jgi:hypothetical protein
MSHLKLSKEKEEENGAVNTPIQADAFKRANSIFVRQQLNSRANNSHVKGIIGPRINLVLLKCK